MKVMTRAAAKKYLALNASALRGLPIMRSIPGTYAGQKRKDKVWVISAIKACELVEDPPEPEWMDEDVHHQLTHRRPRSRLDAIKDRPLAPSYFQFRSSTPFPFLHRRGDPNKIEHGLWCAGCEDQTYRQQWNSQARPDDRTLYRKMMRSFTERDILLHFAECAGATRL